MTNHLMLQFDADLMELRSRLLDMGGKVEKMVIDAMQSFVERDSELAGMVIAGDKDIDRMEMEIDERCLEILAQRQPAARDLRFITLTMKIVTDLERIGDKSRNIARRALELNDLPPLELLPELSQMAELTAAMVADALYAFVRHDDILAFDVCRRDNEVNILNEHIQHELLTLMIDDPAMITRTLKLTAIAKHLERIADHATNVAEMVIFMVNGKDVRHSGLEAT